MNGEMTQLSLKGIRYIELQGLSEVTHSAYPDNSIKTSKFTKYNFIPISLFKLFLNPLMFWFLFISALELSSLNINISQTIGTVVPFALLIIIDLTRQGYNDYIRHILDSNLNKSQVRVWDGNGFVLSEAGKIKVGSVVLVLNNEILPCDMLVLASGNAEHECYMESTNIYGEFSLKIKHAIKELQIIFDSVDLDEAALKLKNLNEELFVPLPNDNFKSFKGYLKLRVYSRKTHLGIENFILRGSRLTNTPWIFGVCLYAGHDCKMFKVHKQLGKKSKIWTVLNRLFVVLFLVVLAVTLCNTVAFHMTGFDLPYTWQEILVSNFVLFGHIIPISLMLTLEIMQITLVPLLHKSSVSIGNPSLMPNLGMVEYIVADKTGTITENDLHISFCQLANTVYWEKKNLNSGLLRLATNNYQDFEVYDETSSYNSMDELAELFAAGCEDLTTFHFIMAMAVCNLAFKSDDEYIALTAHDRELAKGAGKLGIKLLGRDLEVVFVEVLGKELIFDVLGLQQFSSLKKRSRIAITNRETRECFIYAKGNKEAMLPVFSDSLQPDEHIFEGFSTLYLGYKQMKETESRMFLQEYLTAKQSPVNAEGRMESIFEKFEKKLNFLGIVGLEDPVSHKTQKTIKNLSKAGIKFWLLSGDSEEATLGAGLSAGLYNLADPVLRLNDFTSELDFLTVVQDYIEKGIFDAEEIISNSSVNEVNDEKSEFYRDDVATRRSEREVRLTEFSKVQSINKASELREISRSKSRLMSKIRRSTVNPFISKITMRKKKKTKLKRMYNPENVNYVLAIDNTALEYSMCSKQHTKYFISLLFAAKLVCFHSLFPDQKAKVVKILKNFFSFNPFVMAVGNGISDCHMMQEADIGVSISKNSEKLAGSGVDVSIPHFSQLDHLLLEQGHGQYIQVSKMILLSIYAMVLLEVELFLFNAVSGFSSFPMMQKEFIVIYRLVVSVVPVSVVCIIDRDSVSTSITPQAYKAGIFNSVLNLRTILAFACLALVQGSISFVLTYAPMSGLGNGWTEDYALIGGSTMIILFATVMFSVIIENYSVHYGMILIYFCSLSVIIVVTVPLGFGDTSAYHVFYLLGDKSIVWLVICFNVLVNVTISYMFKSIRFVFNPGVLEKVRLKKPDVSLHNKTRLQKYRKSLKNVFRESSVLNNNIVHDSEKIDSRFLRFESEYRETIYQEDKIIEYSKLYKVILLIGGLVSAAYCIHTILVTRPKAASIIYLVLFSLFLLLTLIFPFISGLRSYTSISTILFFLSSQLYYFFSDIVFNNHSSLDIHCYVPVLYIIGFSNFWLQMTLTSLCNSVFVLISMGFYTNSFPTVEKASIIISYTIIYFSILILASTASYLIDNSGRLEFNLAQKVQIEIQKTKNILGYLLPSFVRQRVKQGIRYISDNQGIVSVIFCDIYNFEDLLQHYKANELIAFLDELFAKIDQKCNSSGCTKIETVGKTYMACAGLKDTESDIDPGLSAVSHARRAVEMGIAIINLCENTYLKNNQTLKVKIGINTGMVTAGVVGFHKPQFSLVGDTVNTASRMASLCPGPNQIQISESTKNYMRDTSGLNFTQNMINAKGKGKMLTYIVSIQIKEVKTNSASFNSFEALSRGKETKKITLYQISSSHKDSVNRRSSAIDNLNDVIVEEAGEFRKMETQSLQEIKFMGFGFLENKAEADFRKECCEMNKIILRLGLLLRAFCDLVFLVLCLVQLAFSRRIAVFSIVKLVIELVVLAILWVKFRWNFKKFGYAWALGSFYLVGGVVRLLDFEQNSQVIFADYLLYILQAAMCSALMFTSLFWSITLVAVIQVVIALTKNQMDSQTIISSIGFLVTLLFTLYSRERKLRIFSRIKEAAEKELARTDDLLHKMMPKNVVETLKEQNHVTEEINDVTILYADIAGFTQWSSDKLPDEVVSMLSNLFTEFDHQCVIHDVYKVHTIGDCYVALGYTGNTNRSVGAECFNLATFALHLVSAIHEVNEKHGISLNMRIGIHTGNIIGGIAGTNIVRYDIYGKDVLLANKMESTGQLGKVHISASTKKLLLTNHPNEFLYHKTDTIKSPITGEDIETYFLELK